MKRFAEPFGHWATQAPQPMHAAASMARSAIGLGIGVSVRLRGAAGRDRDEAAGLDDAVEGAAVDHQVLDHREGLGAPGLEVELVAVLEVAHVELADGGAGLRPVRLAVDHEAAGAADPLAAVVLEGDRLLAALGELLVEDVEHLEERACSLTSRASYWTMRPSSAGPF